MRFMTALPIAAVVLCPLAAVAQDAPAVTGVRHVRWIWKAAVELPAGGHVVVIDYHPEFGIRRRHPLERTETRLLEAGRHVLRGDLRHPEARGVVRSVISSMGPNRLIPFMDRPEWPVSFASPALAAMRMPGPVVPDAGRAVAPWQAFVLVLRSPVTASHVDSVLSDHEFSGGARADLVDLAAALGAGSWGGQVAGVRRRYGL